MYWACNYHCVFADLQVLTFIFLFAYCLLNVNDFPEIAKCSLRCNIARRHPLWCVAPENMCFTSNAHLFLVYECENRIFVRQALNCEQRTLDLSNTPDVMEGGCEIYLHQAASELALPSDNSKRDCTGGKFILVTTIQELFPLEYLTGRDV